MPMLSQTIKAVFEVRAETDTRNGVTRQVVEVRAIDISDGVLPNRFDNRVVVLGDGRAFASNESLRDLGIDSRFLDNAPKLKLNGRTMHLLNSNVFDKVYDRNSHGGAVQERNLLCLTQMMDAGLFR